VDLAAGPGVPPAELTDEDVRTLLRRLPEWTGNRHRLSREVAPPDYVADQLLRRLHQLELSAGRRAVVTPQPDGSYRIDVWTHSEDLVTDLDVPFVLAVEDLIEQVLGQRQRTGPPPSPEREVDGRRPPAEPVPGTSKHRSRHRDRDG
jgi:pterin-4a-carbinolamine dehydratase